MAWILGTLSLLYLLSLFSLFFFSFQKQVTAQKGGEEVTEPVDLTCLNIYAHFVKFPALFWQHIKKSDCPCN